MNLRKPALGNRLLKIINLFYLSYVLTTIFIRKVHFPVKSDTLTYAHDTDKLQKYPFQLL